MTNVITCESATADRGRAAAVGEDPAAGDVGVRRLRRHRHHAADRRRAAVRGRATSAPASGCSTSPPATATPRWRRPAASRRVTSTDYVPALLERGRSRAEAEGLDRHLRGRRRRGAAVPGRELRRRALDLRRDVRARPPAGGARADARVPARRADRPGLAGRRRASSASSSGSIARSRAADAGRAARRCCGAREAQLGGVVRGRGAVEHADPRTSRSAIGRPSTSSRCSAPTTARPTRRSRRSTPQGRPRSRPTCWRCCGGATAAAPAWSCAGEYLETVITR